MAALTHQQLEILQRAGDGVPLWGGSTALPGLAGDVQLLLAMRLVEPGAGAPYRITPLGTRALVALGARPPSS